MSGVQLRGTMWINGVPIDLTAGSMSGNFAPNAVSDDGSIAAGQLSFGGAGIPPGVWTAGTGLMRLSDYLTMNGVVIPTGVTFRDVLAISADGRTFVGTALGSFGGRGYVATIPTPGAAKLLGLVGLVAVRRRR